MLAVVIPMYNEQENAERCVRTICDLLTARASSTRLVVVNDGSKDRTESILQRLRREGMPFDLVSYAPNRGYGAALLAGAEHAREAGFEFALFMDSDLTNDPALIPVFEARLAEGRWDLIKASRYTRGGGMRGVPAWRQAFTISGNLVARHLFRMGVTDCTNGFRAVRLAMLSDLQPNERGFASILEELYHLKKKHARATEIPYVLTSRDEAGGASKFSYSPKVLWRYLKYALKAAAISG